MKKKMVGYGKDVVEGAQKAVFQLAIQHLTKDLSKLKSISPAAKELIGHYRLEKSFKSKNGN
jgi:hypothetical protein